MAKTQTPTPGGRKPPARKRTRIRKPKYISLRLRLSPETSSQDSVDYRHHQNHQLNLFPLHPENLYEDKDMHDENVAYLFATDGGATTLTGLLNGVSSEEEPLSPSLNYAYGAAQDNSEECESSLARTALRSKEREVSEEEEEEKWVSYSEVVEKKEKEEEVCSGGGGAAVKWYRNAVAAKGLLSLKLDYEEILNAWSDKGSLYIHGESPQIVPDVHDDILPQDGSNASNGGLWRVPEMGRREASVLRYKEKRQSRLFSKRIRYEVRKLNAEKRPRMKGRFVKRS